MEAIKRELETIRSAHGGILLVEDVVEFAKDDQSALHAKFNWDDTHAAHQFRLSQARKIIRVHVVVLSPSQSSVRAYVSKRMGSWLGSHGSDSF